MHRKFFSLILLFFCALFLSSSSLAALHKSVTSHHMRTHNLMKTCHNLKNQLAKSKVLPVKFEITKGKSCCSVIAKGTGKVFEKHGHDFITIVDKVDDVLEASGWKPTSNTNQYAADSPFSTQFALEKNGWLLLSNIKVFGNLKHCPKNQPIDLYTNCHLKANDRHYVAKFRVVEQ